MAAVAAASESELQAAAALEPAPTPAAPAAAVDARALATLDPRLLMAARRGDSKALKDLLQLTDDDGNDDQQGEETRPDDEGSRTQQPTAAAAASTITSVAAASISQPPPHVIVEVDPRRPQDDAVAVPLPLPLPPPPVPVPVLDEDKATIEGASLSETVEQVVEPAPPHDDDAAALPARQTPAAAPAGHSVVVPVVLDGNGVTTEEGSLLVHSEIVKQVVVEPPPPHDDAVAAPLPPPPPPVPVLDEDGVTTHPEGGSLLVHSEIMEQVVEPPPAHDAALPAQQPPAAAAGAPSVPIKKRKNKKTLAVPSLNEDGVTTMAGDSLLHVVAACDDDDKYLSCAKIIVRNKEKKGGAAAKRLALEARNRKGDTPLHCAAGAGNAKMISCLIDLVANDSTDNEARQEVKQAFVRMQNECGETALHLAVRAARSNMDCIYKLMAVDPELACIRLKDGASPLYLAISLGKINVAEVLDEQCMALSYSGPHGRNVLHAAVHRGQGLLMILQCLLDRNVSLISKLTSQRDNKQKGSTPLHLAASLSESRYTKLLLDANESTAYQADDEGSYPIHVAAWSGSLAVVKMLLERCPDCATLRDGKGRTVLHVAAEEECNAVVEYVCGEMPPQLSSMILNAQDSNGDTALHGAVRAGNLPVFNCLLRNRQVRLDVPNKDGMTPLDLSRTMIPNGFQYELNPSSIVCSSLYAVEALRSTEFVFFRNIKSFREFSKPRSKAPRKQEAGTNSAEESKKYTEATQVMSVVTALIATVTFASAFTLPGGYRADGWPALAGSYAFDAFILADTLAFICSISATCTLLYAGLPAMDISLRHGYINVSAFLLQSAARSLVAAFGLGLYLVVHNTASAIAACAIVFASTLYGNMEVGRIIRMANTVRARIGIPPRAVGICLIYILFQVLVHFWSYVIIFGLPAIRKRVH